MRKGWQNLSGKKEGCWRFTIRRLLYLYLHYLYVRMHAGKEREAEGREGGRGGRGGRGGHMEQVLTPSCRARAGRGPAHVWLLMVLFLVLLIFVLYPLSCNVL